MTCYDYDKHSLDFFKDNSLTVNLADTDSTKTSYMYGFHVTVRYSLEKDKCLVYRTKTLSTGKANGKKWEHNNIFDPGNVQDLILTFKPPNKYFDPGEG